MSCDRAIETALREVDLPMTIRSRRSLGGGHGATVALLTLDDGQKIVCKSSRAIDAAVFAGEALGLQAIEQTQTVAVPRVIHRSSTDDGHVLLMSYLEPDRASPRGWEQFGCDLAAMHQAPQGRQYGFQCDNFLGATLQPNGWMKDWVEFNRRHRFGHQLNLARNRFESSDAGRIESLCENLDEHIPRRPKPALLHGDLWSGNALATTNDRIAVIDPAVYVGDGLADIAMMKLFGGFPQSCFEAYFDVIDDHENVDVRIAVYQLYHVLNHVNLFGRSYVSQAMRLLSVLGY